MLKTGKLKSIATALGLFAVLLCFGVAYADQTVTLAPDTVTVDDGQTFQITATYAVGSDESLTSFGLYIFFNGNLLNATATDIEVLFNTGLIDALVEDDTGDLDSDPLTTKRVKVGYQGAFSPWPGAGQVPNDLIRVTFTASSPGTTSLAAQREPLTGSGAFTGDTTNVTIDDITAPVITILGDNPQTVKIGTTYDAGTDPGATAQDDLDGDISGSVVANYAGVDTSVTNTTSKVVYTVSDAAGNPATAERAVHVVASDVSPSDSTLAITAGPKTANDTDFYTLTVTALQSDGATPVVGVNASFEIIATASGDPASGFTFFNASMPTNGSGVATMDLRSTKADTFTVQATVDGVVISQTQDAQFDPDSPDHIIFTADKRTMSTTGGTDIVIFTATVEDANGNPVSNAGDLTFSFVAPTTLAAFEGATTVAVDVNGNATATVKATGTSAPAPPDDTFSVQVNGVAPLDTLGLGTDEQNPANDFIQITAQNKQLQDITVTASATSTKVGQTIDLEAEGAYDIGDPEPLTTAEWSIKSGDGVGTFNPTTGATTQFFATGAGTVVLQATVAGFTNPDTSNEVSINIGQADPLSLTCPGTVLLGQANAPTTVAGGLGPYTYSISTLPAPAGISVATDGSISVDAATAVAGQYEVTVTDSQAVPQTAICTFNVPMSVTPALVDTDEKTPVTITIQGVPSDATGFTFSSTDLAVDTLGSPTTTVTYTPTDDDTSSCFAATYTATGSTLPAALATVDNQICKTGLIDYTARVVEVGTTTPVGGATVTAAFDATKTTTTDAVLGTFTLADIPVSTDPNATYGFSFSKTGYFPTNLTLTKTEVLASQDVELAAPADPNRLISGTITLFGGGNASTVTVEISNGTLIGTTYPDALGAYVYEVPVGTDPADFVVQARKFGYVTQSETFPGPLPIANANVGLYPATRITPIGDLTAGTLDLLILGEAGTISDFKGDDSDIDISGDYVTTDFTYNGLLGGYENTGITYSSSINLSILVDMSQDRTLATDPSMSDSSPAATQRAWCYVAGQNAEVSTTVDNPSANGGDVATTEGATVSVLPGAVTTSIPDPDGSVREKLTLVAIDADAATAYNGATTQLVGGPIVEIALLEADGQAVSAIQPEKVLITMPYDAATITSEQILSGQARIYSKPGFLRNGSFTTGAICEMIAETVDTGFGIVPISNITEVTASTVTFWVDSPGAYAISSNIFPALPPTITLSPSSVLVNASPTTVVITGSNFIGPFTATTAVTFDGNPITVDAFTTTTLTITVPTGTAARSVPVVVDNGSVDQTATKNFSYRNPTVTPPPATSPPVVDFEVVGYEDIEEGDVIEIDAGTTLEFRDLSSGVGVYAWQWYFNADDPNAGEDFFSDQQNPTFTYEEGGTYSVRLQVFGGGGQGSRLREDFIVVTAIPVDPPVASFTVEPDVTGTAPYTVTLTDTSTGEITSLVWLVNNVPVSASAVLPYTFQQTGQYEVTLRVIGPGGEDTATQSVTVTEQGSFVPNFEFTVNGLTVNFTDISTPADMIQFRLWDFGDGATAEGATVSRAYEAPGTYTVVLTLVDENMNETTVTKTVTVTQVTPGDITAAFIASPTSGNAPLTVQFTDQSTSAGQITGWSWSFGDGGTSSAASPTYVYTAAGTYTATLTVTGTEGTDSTSTTITVSDVVVDPGDIVDPPTLIYPVDGEDGVPTKPTLRVDDYSDGSNTYGHTEWQIALDCGFAESDIIWKEMNTETTFTVPDLVLDAGLTDYCLRVRFVDADGLASDWTGPIRFTTVEFDDDDLDGNGVPDDQEVDDPAVNFPGLTPGDLIKFARNGDLEIALEGMDFVDAVQYLMFMDDIVCDGSGSCTFPAGWIGFKVHMNAVGAMMKVKLHFSSDLPEGISWYQHNAKKGCVSFDDAVEQLDARTVVISITDGGDGDADELENGIVVDPISYCVIPATGGGGGGGSDTCFIGTVGSAGGMGIGFLAAFAAMLSGALAIRARRK